MLATIQRYSVFLIVLMLLVSPANGKNTDISGGIKMQKNGDLKMLSFKRNRHIN